MLRTKFVEILQTYQQVERDYRQRYKQRVERQFRIGLFLSIMQLMCANAFCAPADRYLEQLKHAKVKGYLFQQQNYVPKQ